MRGVLLGLVLMTMTMEAGMAQSKFVLATYRVAETRQAEFLELLKEAERVMREEGLITGRPAIRMRSENPELLLEVFEWVDGEAFGKAQQNPRVLELWGRFEAVWKEGAIPLEVFPEAKGRWVQLEALGGEVVEAAAQ